MHRGRVKHRIGEKNAIVMVRSIRKHLLGICSCSPAKLRRSSARGSDPTLGPELRPASQVKRGARLSARSSGLILTTSPGRRTSSASPLPPTITIFHDCPDLRHIVIIKASILLQQLNVVHRRCSSLRVAMEGFP